MRYEIVQKDQAVEIQVRDTAGQTSTLLESLRDCAEGRCGCPTDQDDRLAALEVTATDDEVTVRLRPRVGEHLDPVDLHACLDYTLAQAEQA